MILFLHPLQHSVPTLLPTFPGNTLLSKLVAQYCQTTFPFLQKGCRQMWLGLFMSSRLLQVQVTWVCGRDTGRRRDCISGIWNIWRLIMTRNVNSFLTSPPLDLWLLPHWERDERNWSPEQKCSLCGTVNVSTGEILNLHRAFLSFQRI